MSSDAETEALETTYTAIGAILAIGASIFNAIGYTIQKKGHNILKEYNQKHPSAQKRLPQEKVWIMGFGVYLIGGLMNAVSLFFAPQSLVLPLSAITLVANTYMHILFKNTYIQTHTQYLTQYPRIQSIG